MHGVQIPHSAVVVLAVLVALIFLLGVCCYLKKWSVVWVILAIMGIWTAVMLFAVAQGRAIRNARERAFKQKVEAERKKTAISEMGRDAARRESTRRPEGRFLKPEQGRGRVGNGDH